MHVTSNFALDALVVCFAFLAGTYLRLPGDVSPKVITYWPGILFAALLVPSVLYIFGLYSAQSSHQGVFKRSIVIFFSLAFTAALMFGIFYLKKSLAIGRGVMLGALPLTFFALLWHHFMLLRFLRNYRERVAFVVSSHFDEVEARLFANIAQQNLELVGVICASNYQPGGEMRVLGKVNDLSNIVSREAIDRILCSNKSINDPAMCRAYCALRYSGVTVMPLINLFEEIHQLVPLELITPEWLLNASSRPHFLYINKLKRGFDIVVSLIGLIFPGGPLLLIGLLLVKLTSRGPVFYRQTRCGRFGKIFQVIKLRTMMVDAEKEGAVWASANDSRVTPVGGFLRKYRIDEIPQLINVIRGEMSFVGPRPERPEFIADLAREIPYFQERLMVQPGITGWAQVNYPYGANVEDARRKLEFDLYYTKNMSLFLDTFILLDTVRIILRGGLGESHKNTLLDTSMFRDTNTEHRAQPALASEPATASR